MKAAQTAGRLADSWAESSVVPLAFHLVVKLVVLLVENWAVEKAGWMVWRLNSPIPVSRK